MSEIYGELVKNVGIVPAIWDVDLNTGANAGDYISMKNYNRCCFIIHWANGGGTCAVTLYEAKTAAGGSAQALAFTKQYQTGVRLKINTATGIFTVGETVTGGSSSLTGVVYKASRDEVLLHTITGGLPAGWTDGETLTGGTSGYTAKADGTGQDEDMLLEKAVSSNTFTIPNVDYRTYVVEVTADMLSDGFDFVQIRLAQATGPGYGGVTAILYEPRVHSVPMPTAIYD